MGTSPREAALKTTVGNVTALNPVLSYDKTTELASQVYKTNKGVIEQGDTINTFMILRVPHLCMPSSRAVPDFLGAILIAFMSGTYLAEPLGGSSRV